MDEEDLVRWLEKKCDPGEIHLKKDLPRFCSIADERDFRDPNSVFCGLGERISDHPFWRRVEELLNEIPDSQWPTLKKKLRKESKSKSSDRYWSQFFCMLNEIFAYDWLLQNGATDIEFITGKGQPDLKANWNGEVFLEVKTILESDRSLKIWKQPSRPLTVSNKLSPDRKQKISTHYEKAKKQLDRRIIASTRQAYVFFVYETDVDQDTDPELGSDIMDYLESIEDPKYEIMLLRKW